MQIDEWDIGAFGVKEDRIDIVDLDMADLEIWKGVVSKVV